MDRRHSVATLREARLLVSQPQSAHGARASAATRCGEEAPRDLEDVVFSVLVVLVPEIAAVPVEVVVIKEVHIVMLIIEECTQLRTAVMRSNETAFLRKLINPNVLNSLIVIKQSYLGVAALTLKETSSH